LRVRVSFPAFEPPSRASLISTHSFRDEKTRAFAMQFGQSGILAIRFDFFCESTLELLVPFYPLCLCLFLFADS